MSVTKSRAVRDHAEHVLTHQAAQKAPPASPQGRKLVGNLGPGTLRPGAGDQVQRTRQPLFCGTMFGVAYGVTEAPNPKDPRRMSLRFAGEVNAIDFTGRIQRGAEWYLPATPSRAIKAALTSGPVTFAFEIWCEPDEAGRPKSPLGYSYVTYDRIPQRQNDPLLALAYEAGILERPAASLPAPEPEEGGEIVDPETGEVRPAEATAA